MAPNTIPVDAYSWLGLSVVFLLLFIRSIIHYRKFRNPLTLSLAIMGFNVFLAGQFYGLSLFFSANLDLITKYYFVGDIFLYSAAVCVSYPFWLLIVQSKIKYKLYLLISLIIGLVIPIIAKLNSREYIAKFDLDGTFRSPQIPISRLLISIIMVMSVIVGLYFIQKATQSVSRGHRSRSAMLGVFYIGIGMAMIIQNTISFNSKVGLTLNTAMAGASAIGLLIFFLLPKKS